MPQRWDVIVIGGGAAGLFCAIEAGKRGRKVLVIEHSERIGKKIAISGGGRCNFTNIHTSRSQRSLDTHRATLSRSFSDTGLTITRRSWASFFATIVPKESLTCSS